MTAKNAHAVALGKLGGRASADALTPAERTARALKAVRARKTHKGWPKGKPRKP